MTMINYDPEEEAGQVNVHKDLEVAVLDHRSLFVLK
jgi:hypothetical protein